MGLMDNQKFIIKQEYTKVWDVVEQLYKLSNNDWSEVAQFLGHHDFDTELQLYYVDSFFKIHAVSFNFEPIRNLIETLSTMWFEQDDEELKNLKFKLYSYYWSSFDLCTFEPLNSIGLIIDTVTPNNNGNLPTQNPIGCGTPTLQQTEPTIESLNAEIARLRNLVADQTTEIQDLKSKIQELETRQPIIQNAEPDPIDLTPEQEIPNSRQRNNVLNIIKVLVNMAGLPSEPYTAFNMMEAHATSKDMELPSKDTMVKWTHKSS